MTLRRKMTSNWSVSRLKGKDGAQRLAWRKLQSLRTSGLTVQSSPTWSK